MPMVESHFEFWPERAPRSLPLPETGVFHNLEVSARRYPEKAALVYYGTEISYERLLGEAEGLAGYLQWNLGVDKGDRVTLYVQNSPQFVVAFYAVLRAGAVVVPVNPMLVAEELGHYVEDSGAKAAIVGQDLYSRISGLLGEGGLERIIVAAYSDYLEAETDLEVPDVVSAPRREIADEGVITWSEALSGGGAPLPEAVGEKLHDLTGLRYQEGYGLTETISQTHVNPPDCPKLQCLGVSPFDVDARVVNPETLEELGPNEEGEVVVLGPQVMRGYWKRPEADEEAFFERDGKRFFRTGDIAVYDEEGYFFMVDRLKRMINASGYKVWPAEVESTLYKHPSIQEACVIGVPDEQRGEAPKAFVVLRDGEEATAEDIISWSKEQMAAYKYPRSVEFIDELPKSGSGKILWRQLQEREQEKTAKAK